VGWGKKKKMEGVRTKGGEKRFFSNGVFLAFFVWGKRQRKEQKREPLGGKGLTPKKGCGGRGKTAPREPNPTSKYPAGGKKTKKVNWACQPQTEPKTPPPGKTQKVQKAPTKKKNSKEKKKLYKTLNRQGPPHLVKVPKNHPQRRPVGLFLGGRGGLQKGKSYKRRKKKKKKKTSRGKSVLQRIPEGEKKKVPHREKSQSAKEKSSRKEKTFRARPRCQRKKNVWKHPKKKKNFWGGGGFLGGPKTGSTKGKTNRENGKKTHRKRTRPPKKKHPPPSLKALTPGKKVMTEGGGGAVWGGESSEGGRDESKKKWHDQKKEEDSSQRRNTEGKKGESHWGGGRGGHPNQNNTQSNESRLRRRKSVIGTKKGQIQGGVGKKKKSPFLEGRDTWTFGARQGGKVW